MQAALGKCQRPGAVSMPDGAVQFRTWAPNAHAITLVLINGGHRRLVPMAADERGFFHHLEPKVSEGQRYALRLDDGPERPDPASQTEKIQEKNKKKEEKDPWTRV